MICDKCHILKMLFITYVHLYVSLLSYDLNNIYIYIYLL
jgi:hypothetical protein